MNFETINTRELFMELVVPLQQMYAPAAATTEHTRHVDLTAVVGCAGVGKNTLMSLTGLDIVTSDTTREERENDGVMERHGVEYFFRGNELYEVYQDIVNGEYVQWAPGPNNNIYGSRNSAYPVEGPALIDVVARAVPAVRGLRENFRSLEVAYVVKETYSEWIGQLISRGKIEEEDLNSRKLEALDSLTFGLEDHEVSFIVNVNKERAAEELKSLALLRQEPRSQRWARNCGFAMLCGLRQELGLPVSYTVG